MKKDFKFLFLSFILGAFILSSLSAEKIPRFGSSGRLEGKIAVVTLFLDDARTSWNWNKEQDVNIYNYAYYDIHLACDWITKACKEYGRNVTFVWDWDKYPQLCFSGERIRVDVTDLDNQDVYKPVQAIIRRYIDSEKIKKELGANGIIYLACFNTPPSNNITSSTLFCEKDYPLNEEICYMFMQCENDIEAPAFFAHEILHTFGAPDLYTPGMYGITQRFVDYMEDSRNNDIMGSYCAEDPRTGELTYDTIPNVITDITAYYLGLTNSSKTVQKWGFEPSAYVSR